MGHITTDIRDIYNTYFQEPYKIAPEFNAGNYNNYANQTTVKGDMVVADYNGINIYLPVKLVEVGGQILNIRCCTIKATSKRTIIRTAVPERVGTVKECYNTGDWSFALKGVLIGENNRYPDNKIEVLREIYESMAPVELYCPLVSLLVKSKRIAIESLEFGDLEGKSIKHQPFVMVCESDTVEDLYV